MALPLRVCRVGGCLCALSASRCLPPPAHRRQIGLQARIALFMAVNVCLPYGVGRAVRRGVLDLLTSGLCSVLRVRSKEVNS